MTISMWQILESLEEYRPEGDIREGQPRIGELRLVTAEENGPWPARTVCVSRWGGGVRIFNGADIVALRDVADPGGVINRLMALKRDCDAWETALQRAAVEGDVQAVVDRAAAMLGNPLRVFDMQGGLLAGSDAPPEAGPGGSPAFGAGIAASGGWNGEPVLYALPGGQAVGGCVAVDGAVVAGFELREACRPIRPGDMHLVRRVQAALAVALESRAHARPQRTLARILGDMLAGLDFEAPLYGMLRLPCEAPWRLMILENPGRRPRDAMILQLLMSRLQETAQPCVTLEFDGRIVALASEGGVGPLLQVVNGESGRPGFTVCLSLPFDDLHDLKTRYDQTLFALGLCRGQPGVFRGEDSALRRLSALEAVRAQRLAHPLLQKLREHDAQKHGELYETLRQYLIHERSLQHGANALHIHKNTFAYRMDRVRELSGVDLDDPMTRLYLLVSFVLDGALPDGASRD